MHWISSNEVDKTGAYCTEWSKSERKTPIQYINTYICNLERWEQWPYMLDSKKRHRCKEQSFGLYGRRQGWDDLREWHWNMYITCFYFICEIDGQSKFNAWIRALKASALGQPKGMRWKGRWEGVWDVGHMYTHSWFMSMYGKSHHNIVKQLASNKNK